MPRDICFDEIQLELYHFFVLFAVDGADYQVVIFNEIVRLPICATHIVPVFVIR